MHVACAELLPPTAGKAHVGPLQERATAYSKAFSETFAKEMEAVMKQNASKPPTKKQ